MPRTYLVFGDIQGKLAVLRVECTRCQRKGRYSDRKLGLTKEYINGVVNFRDTCTGEWAQGTPVSQPNGSR
jgi:hypothetical protein